MSKKPQSRKPSKPSKPGKPAKPGRKPQSKGRPQTRAAREEHGTPAGKAAGKPKKDETAHTSGWKTSANKQTGKKSTVRAIPGKTWRGKPVVEVKNTTRLNKYIANSGMCSRRDADELIKQGLVEVNGKQVTEMGYQVKENDKVTYAGERINPELPTYVVLNKPKDFTSTAKDPTSPTTALTLLRRVGNIRLTPVDKLNRGAMGLLIYTNDGDLVRKLTHTHSQVPTLYHLHLDKALKPMHLDAMMEGVELETGKIKVAHAEFVNDGKDRKQIGVEMHGGKSRRLDKLMAHLGYRIVKLDRVMYAGLTKKDLPRGRWRHLTKQEVSRLKMI